MERSKMTLLRAMILAGVVALGCGGGDSAPTRGSQCRQVLDVTCKRFANPCTILPSDQVNVCIDTGTAACCNGMCGARAISTQAEIDICIGDIRVASCAGLDVTNGGTLPATCVGVVRSALVSSQTAALRAKASGVPETVGELLSR